MKQPIIYTYNVENPLVAPPSFPGPTLLASRVEWFLMFEMETHHATPNSEMFRFLFHSTLRQLWISRTLCFLSHLQRSISLTSFTEKYMIYDKNVKNYRKLLFSARSDGRAFFPPPLTIANHVHCSKECWISLKITYMTITQSSMQQKRLKMNKI